MLLLDPALKMAAETLDDIEKARIAAANRVQMLTRTEEDKDGQVRGKGLNLFNPTVESISALLEGLELLEKEAISDLQRAMKRHALGPWIKNQTGIGEKQMARLLGSIGDPYWNSLHERPRTVSELWAYCGYSVVDGAAQKRRKGQPCNWSLDARMRARMIAESCLKLNGGVDKNGKTRSESPYRKYYDLTREKFDGTITDMHSHNRALRVMSKEILKDLWIESKRLHSLM